MRTLDVHLNDQRVGQLFEGSDLWSFTYDEAWSIRGGFDLAPGLPRSKAIHEDGGSNRPVQWYFDNLLPEEKLRETVSKEAGIRGDDAFALLAYLGAESAGSLVLLPPGEAAPQASGQQPLSQADLSRRIRNLPRESLSKGAPKRMSVAGAQNKLLVIYDSGALFEPVGIQPSTHILKPNHSSDNYPSSVINEYLMMRLAGKLGLQVPRVWRHYVPEAVYIVERFDRYSDPHGSTQRKHIIDACQLLNKSRTFKNSAANLDTLQQCIGLCRNKASARLVLFRWLMFNVLIGNDDNHLKNISFSVSAEGIDICPHYDLLSTSVYHTIALVDQRAIWPHVPMMIALPSAETFGQVSRMALLEAAQLLGLSQRIGQREIERMSTEMPKAMAELVREIEHENALLEDPVKPQLAGELRLIRGIQHVVVSEMLARIGG
jgi:serine/threonine-protein kinase HipA